MIVKIDKSLVKDISKINDKVVLKKLRSTITKIQSSTNLSEIRSLKKLKGFHNYFRIGDYRLGIIYHNNKIEIIRLLHRKEIYKYFP